MVPGCKIPGSSIIFDVHTRCIICLRRLTAALFRNCRVFRIIGVIVKYRQTYSGGCVSDIRVDKMAQVLVDYSVNVQPGDRVLIEATMLAEPLVRSLYRRVLSGAGIRIFY
jgi:hypothetical protein